MKKSLMVAPALLSVVALALGGCAEAPGTGTGTGSSAEPGGAASDSASASSSASGSAGAGGAGFKACMVSDAGGFDDKSFNQTAYKGLTDAKSALGIESGQIESSRTADFAQNIQSMVSAKCNIVVTVGFLLGDDTLAAAKKNPNVKFAIVDNNRPDFAGVKNLKPLVFNTAESSFMAGYLAAGTSKSKKVGTFGGAKIPTVTIFMDGFSQGVDYYNKQKGADVKVLGWNVDKQDGLFIPGANPFGDVPGGKRTAQGLVSQGADVILPVAGPSGEGALQVAKTSGGKVSAIWVDTDGCVSAASYCPQIQSSVYKGMDVAVADVIKATKDGSFSNKPYVGNLENDGTGLAPYHEFDGKIPAELKSEIDKIKADIISGTIKIESKSQPK
ncbi:MAG TPA: BMP family ABC transporter substrate-binding protein [Propionibacteriaceae bacterium]|nr:BMP family ABC transporter substrate-binding protein [Propionibacteriaceae bacterium]